ncbi:MAG: LysM peptidoglycan-binding domain-containing protein [Bacteriovoracaceae bacterium]|nr:LysM peptidoglycan-binding domain-containing protein [Bacteriovoracaceae bacterium]
MNLLPWLVILSFSLVSCSGSKSAQKVNEETPQIELSDADEFIENPAEGDQSLVETGAQEVTATEESVPETSLMDAPVVSETSTEAAPVISNDAGMVKQYTVQKNETLMLIAFKLYGDYELWKDLANQNREALKGSTNIKEGMVLNYTAPAEEFVWNPQGLPYLIRTGDTLGGISKQVYTTISKWKLIWENNRPLIKDPNKIYAGFTIYYLENGREVANEI